MTKKPNKFESMAQNYSDYVAEAKKKTRPGEAAKYSCVITNADTGDKKPVEVDLHM